MARPPATPEQRALVRERLRAAAAEIHRHEGAEAVTVRSVTKLAGVSPGALYNSFSSIGELLRSLWMDPVMESGSQMAQIGAAHPDPVDRIRAYLRAFVDFVGANPDIHRGAMLYVRPPSAPPPETDEPAALPFYRLLREAIVDGQDLGRLRAGDPDRLTQLTWSAIHGAMALPHNASIYELERGADVADDMIELVLRGITPDA